MIGFNGGIIGKTRTTSIAGNSPGVWGANEQALLQRDKKWQYLRDDANYSSVSLLLLGNGLNNGTTFTDYSSQLNIPARSGNVITSTSTFKYYDSSVYFDGSGDLLTYAASSNWNFSSGPHTAECWVYFNTLPASGNNLRLLMAGPNANASSLIFFNVGSTGGVSMGVPLTGRTGLDSSQTVSTGQWHHLAAVINGASSLIAVDGTATTGTCTNPTSSNSLTLRLGFDTVSTVNFNFNGYIQDLRITKNVARYTASFTPPDSFLL
jgi:hypothetical protein